MVWVYISLGSNIDREANTRAGISALQSQYGELILSSVYESEAVGFEGSSFFNMVIALKTEEPVERVAQRLHQIEEDHGRVRGGPRFSSRTLDLDLLLYDDLRLDEPGLQIPRDEILQRAFVLWPLAEVAPDLKHPVVGKSYAQLWFEFDKSQEQLKPIVFDFDFDVEDEL
ncbi:MAG: 2-amino-4-hydroxy-6-hydroxymethyldihydropteridine diphosphokinase [Gammaproteobacteria bacterium]